MINQINPETKNVSLIARVEKVFLSTGNNGSNYLIVNLIDASGRVEARLWNANEKDIETLKNGVVIKIEGVVNVYRQQLQIKISSYLIINEKDFKDYDINEDMFSINAPLNIDGHYKKVMELIDSLENNVYKQITKTILEEYEKEFKTFPAAISIHHNVVGGLFWHSFSLLMAAKGLKETYKYATIDWELVYCGALLHDIGKVIEMEGKNAAEYTDEGKLLGHITIGNNFVFKKSLDLNLEKEIDVIKLQHVILASHGKNEYGSPVEPMLIEGVIISSLDALDARIYKINDELSKVENNGWTSRILSEEGRSYLKHFSKLNKKSKNNP